MGGFLGHIASSQLPNSHFDSSFQCFTTKTTSFSHFGSKTPKKNSLFSIFLQVFSGAFLLKKGTLGHRGFQTRFLASLAAVRFAWPWQQWCPWNVAVHGGRSVEGCLVQWYKKGQHTKQNHQSTSDSLDWEDSQTKKAPKLQRHRVGWDHCKFDKKMWMHVDKHPTEETWIWKQCYSMRRGKEHKD